MLWVWLALASKYAAITLEGPMHTLALVMSVATGAPVEGTWRAESEAESVAGNIRAAVDTGRAVAAPPPRHPSVRGLAIRCDEQKTAVTLVHGLVDEHTVTQSFRTREGTRTSRLTLLPDGTLEMAVSIRSERLSEPLEYTLTYLR